MEIIILAVFSLSNILCFMLGARVGQQAHKGEEIKLPEINPMEIYRKHQSNKEALRVKEKVDAIMRNIDTYDGTPEGQEDIPR